MEITLTIKLDPAEIFKAVADQDYNEFRLKLNKVADEYHNQKPSEKEHDEAAKKISVTTSKLIKSICNKCGKTYIRTGVRQKYCSPECGLKKKWKMKSNHEPIDKTLEEINKIQSEREKEPYIFQH